MLVGGKVVAKAVPGWRCGYPLGGFEGCPNSRTIVGIAMCAWRWVRINRVGGRGGIGKRNWFDGW